MASVNMTWEVAGNPESFDIFRSLTEIDPLNPPVPLATGVVDREYEDNTVEEDKTYFYMVASVKGAQRKMSSQITVFTSQLWLSSGAAIQLAFEGAQIFHSLVGSAVRDTMGGSYSGGSKWVGSVLAQDGKIYCSPLTSQFIMVIDPQANTASLNNFGLTIPTGNKYNGNVLAQDGKIYCIPASTTYGVLVIDPALQTAYFETFGVDMTGPFKWSGGILAPNGKIYCIPYSSSDILIIDVANGSAERNAMGMTLTGTAKFNGGVLAPNGKIYCVPYGSNSILVIDPESGTTYAFPSPVTGSTKFFGGALAADGKIYCAPNSSSGVLVIDPATDTAEFLSYVDLGVTSPSGTSFSGCCTGPDGKIYFIPYGSTLIGVFDPLEPVLTEKMKFMQAAGAAISGTGKWIGCSVGENGTIYSVPFNSLDILKISMNAGVDTPDGRMLRSPHFNKL